MAGSGVTIRVEGIKELQRALRTADKMLPRELKRGMDVIAREILLPVIASKMEAAFVLPLGDKKGTHKFRSGKLLESLRAVSQQRAGIVKEGVASTPYAGWWEFGGTTHTSRGSGEREFIHEGRTMYPALHETGPAIEAEMEHVMSALRRIIEEG